MAELLWRAEAWPPLPVLATATGCTVLTAAGMLLRAAKARTPSLLLEPAVVWLPAPGLKLAAAVFRVDVWTSLLLFHAGDALLELKAAVCAAWLPAAWAALVPERLLMPDSCMLAVSKRLQALAERGISVVRQPRFGFSCITLFCHRSRLLAGVSSRTPLFEPAIMRWQ